MKFVRFGSAGAERPGLIDEAGALRDLSDLVSDIDHNLFDVAQSAKLNALNPSELPLVDGSPRLGPCFAGVRKIVCVGLNYTDHAAESKMPVPTEPILFLKPSSSICGPFDDVEIPRGSQKTDWEVELGVVIGRRAKYVSEAEAMEYVAGYCVVNDVSERAYQLERLGQWDKGKAHDTFAPIGPWFVTKDEVPDPQNLALWLDINGQRYQAGNTANMVFGVEALIAYISNFMTLEPGDVISTGTPAGVGMGQTPPKYLKPGDEMRLGIEGLGEQVQSCISTS